MPGVARVGPNPLLLPLSISDPRSPTPDRIKFVRSSKISKLEFRPPFSTRTSSFDDDFSAVALLSSETDGVFGGNSYVSSSSEGEETDGELFMPSTDGDYELSSPQAAHRGHRKRRRIQPGFIINLGPMVFSFVFLLLVDWWVWRIVRLPLQPFYLTLPFFISLALSTFSGFMYIPLLRRMKFYHLFRRECPSLHSFEKRIPTMGGLIFVPIGIAVASTMASFSSVEVSGVAAVTLALTFIGLIDDVLSYSRIKKYRLSGLIKFLLQVAVGIWFCFWLESANISTPYMMKFLVPLPSPFGLVYLGKFYMVLTSLSFMSMGYGVHLADDLHGLAGGTAALALIGMSVAVLPLCPDLAIFGASLAGSCLGFLVHNRFRASIFMGNTGSLALGGALAAMAACSGMFLPMFVSSIFFYLDVSSVIMQVFFSQTTKHILGSRRSVIRVTPFHHYLESCGLQEPVIVTSVYILSCILSLFAAYVGLISA